MAIETTKPPESGMSVQSPKDNAQYEFTFGNRYNLLVEKGFVQSPQTLIAEVVQAYPVLEVQATTPPSPEPEKKSDLLKQEVDNSPLTREQQSLQAVMEALPETVSRILEPQLASIKARLDGIEKSLGQPAAETQSIQQIEEKLKTQIQTLEAKMQAQQALAEQVKLLSDQIASLKTQKIEVPTQPTQQKIKTNKPEDQKTSSAPEQKAENKAEKLKKSTKEAQTPPELPDLRKNYDLDTMMGRLEAQLVLAKIWDKNGIPYTEEQLAQVVHTLHTSTQMSIEQAIQAANVQPPQEPSTPITEKPVGYSFTGAEEKEKSPQVSTDEKVALQKQKEEERIKREEDTKNEIRKRLVGTPFQRHVDAAGNMIDADEGRVDAISTAIEAKRLSFGHFKDSNGNDLRGEAFVQKWNTLKRELEERKNQETDQEKRLSQEKLSEWHKEIPLKRTTTPITTESIDNAVNKILGTPKPLDSTPDNKPADNRPKTLPSAGEAPKPPTPTEIVRKALESKKDPALIARLNKIMAADPNFLKQFYKDDKLVADPEKTEQAIKEWEQKNTDPDYYKLQPRKDGTPTSNQFTLENRDPYALKPMTDEQRKLYGLHPVEKPKTPATPNTTPSTPQPTTPPQP